LDRAAAERLRALGVRVRGDLSWYGEPQAGDEAGPTVSGLPESVPLDIAVAAVLGASEPALRLRNAGPRALAGRLLRSVTGRRPVRDGRGFRSGAAASVAGAGPASR
ncbi:hypothetical protein, partial [Propionicimonas sp.]|uniref:hypothetical protein n=1 Tax=Propionicimonas sp. TaxID=1955623 RepID=UPI0039E335E8